jgi:hypothetical protein
VDDVTKKKIDHDKFKERLLTQYEPAINDAMVLGVGFIIVRRVCGNHTYDVKHASWSKVIDALEDLGAIGNAGGKE